MPIFVISLSILTFAFMPFQIEQDFINEEKALKTTNIKVLFTIIWTSSPNLVAGPSGLIGYSKWENSVSDHPQSQTQKLYDKSGSSIKSLKNWFLTSVRKEEITGVRGATVSLLLKRMCRIYQCPISLWNQKLLTEFRDCIEKE